MADNDNTITLVGRIGQEPEFRVTTKGDVLNFSIATSERKRDADGGWSDGPTSWFRVAAWDDLARNAHASFHRGQQVIVRGLLTVREFQSDGRGKSRNVELRATALGHDLRWGTTSFTDGRRSSVTTGQAPQQIATTSEAVPTEERRGGDWGAPPAETTERAPERETVPAGPLGDWSDDDGTPF